MIAELNTAPDLITADDLPVFRLPLPDVTYDGIRPLRLQLSAFLNAHGIAPACAAMLALTASEILTNLAKHPPEKSRQTEVKLRLHPKFAALDISDDSTAFAEFDARCHEARRKPAAAECLEESGYGLACILRQHAQVSYTPKTASPDGLNHFRVRHVYPVKTAFAASAAKHKLFLVDDDAVQLRRHEAMLSSHYDVICFDRAMMAAKAFEKERPELVVSDLNMPEMDGIGLRQALSALPRGNATPFVFLSAETAKENSPYISELGVDDFLLKPVKPEKLLGVVRRLLARAGQVRRAHEGRFHADVTDALKPALPARFGNWRICVRTVAAEAGGGDFTLSQQTSGHFLAVLADVMGHGQQAKFFSYAYAGYLRSLFRLQAAGADPTQFLANLSRSIDGDALLESIILTCQSFQLFPDGRAAIASAGHPPPLLLRAGGAVALESAGPLPGLMVDANYNLLTLQLARGDKLVFATDGFLAPFGHEGSARPRLIAQLDDLTETGAEAAADALWQHFESINHTTLKDDATLVVAEYGESP